MTTATPTMTENEAIAFVFANAAKPYADKTRLNQTALKRHPDRKVRRANLMMKRWATIQGMTLEDLQRNLDPSPVKIAADGSGFVVDTFDPDEEAVEQELVEALKDELLGAEMEAA